MVPPADKVLINPTKIPDKINIATNVIDILGGKFTKKSKDNVVLRPKNKLIMKRNQKDFYVFAKHFLFYIHFLFIRPIMLSLNDRVCILIFKTFFLTIELFFHKLTYKLFF